MMMKNRYLLLLLAFLVAVSVGNARAVPANPKDITEAVEVNLVKREYTNVSSRRDLGGEVTLEARVPPSQLTKKETPVKKTTPVTTPGKKQKTPVTPVTAPVNRQKTPVTPVKKKPVGSCPLKLKKPAGTPGSTNKTPTKPGTRRLAKRTQKIYDMVERDRKKLTDKMSLADLTTKFNSGQYIDQKGNEPTPQDSIKDLMSVTDADNFISKKITNKLDQSTDAASKGMKYIDSYLPSKGVIIVQDVSNGNLDITSYPLRFTDILSKDWQEACQQTGSPVSGLKWVVHDTIVNPQTEGVLDEFRDEVACVGSEIKIGDNELYKLTYKLHKDWFLKFLGSPNGKPTAYLAADYSGMLGGKTIVAIHVDLESYSCVFEFGII